MPAFPAACGSFQVKSSSTSLVTVFVTVRLLPFFLTVALIRSCTLIVSTFRVRSYTDHRYWSMQSSVRTHSSEASSGLTFTSGSTNGTFMTGSPRVALASGSARAVLNSGLASAASEWARAAIASRVARHALTCTGARAALTCRSVFAGPAQSRTAKLPHTKQPTPLTSLMFAPHFPDSRLEARYGCFGGAGSTHAGIPPPCLARPHHAVALTDGPGRGLSSVRLTRRVKSQ